MTIPDTLLLEIAAVELVLLALGWLFLLSHGFRERLRGARLRTLRSARDLMAGAALTRSITEPGRSALSSLRRAEQRKVLKMLAPNLQGDEREWLGRLSAELGLVEHGLTLCRSPFWWRRLQGARLLTLLGGGGNRVLEMAGDPHPLVRGQVATWCGANPSAAAVSTLVGMLGDPSQASRFAVQDALVRLSGAVAEPLAEKMDGLRDETEARVALAVAYALRDNRLAASIVRLTEHESPEVRAAAYRALGMTGGEHGESRLEEGLADPESSVRAAAALAMGELAQWQDGRLVAPLLGDGSWDVRSAAGRSLLLMGPPGELLLRRSLDDPDPFVSDMARHTLDVAAVVEGRA